MSVTLHASALLSSIPFPFGEADSFVSRHGRIEVERIKFLYVHTKTGVFASLVNVGIIMFILWDVIPHFLVFVWVTGVLTISFCLFLLVRKFDQANPRGEETLKWRKPFLTDNDYLRKPYTQKQLSTILTKWLWQTPREATPLLSTEKEYAYPRRIQLAPLGRILR
jgi:hypothetical protein